MRNTCRLVAFLYNACFVPPSGHVTLSSCLPVDGQQCTNVHKVKYTPTFFVTVDSPLSAADG